MTIDEEIKLLKKELYTYRKKHKKIMSAQVRQLRDFILHTHFKSEFSLGLAIDHHFISKLSKTTSVFTRFKLAFALHDLYPFMDYVRKLTFVKDHKIFPDHLIENLYKLNDIRIHFAHDYAKQKAIEKYHDKQKYLTTLRLLVAIESELDKLLFEIIGKTFANPPSVKAKHKTK